MQPFQADNYIIILGVVQIVCKELYNVYQQLNNLVGDVSPRC